MGLDRSYQSSYANIYSTLRCVLDDMDIVQALDDLEHRLISLRDRTASKMVADQPVATKSDSTEVAFTTLKAKTDDLSKSSINVLKYYATMDVDKMTPSELYFYKRYVIPVIHLLK